MVYLFHFLLYLVYFVVESLLTASTISLLTKQTRLTIVMGGLPTASVVVMESLLVSRILCSCLGLPHLFSGQTTLIRVCFLLSCFISGAFSQNWIKALTLLLPMLNGSYFAATALSLDPVEHEQSIYEKCSLFITPTR